MSQKKQPGEEAQEPASAAQEPEAEAAPAEPEAEPGEARQPAGATAEPEAPAQADLVAELAREREKTTDYMQRWQRAQADLANYRRRVEQEREQLQAFAPVPIFIEILKVLDNYQRAFETLPTELRDFSWVQGVMLTYGYLENLLHVYGVKPLETKAGQAFDPAYHQAVTHEETDAYPDGTITAEYQRGYIFHERVLRPALVRVARPKTTATSAQDTKAGEPQT